MGKLPALSSDFTGYRSTTKRLEDPDDHGVSARRGLWPSQIYLKVELQHPLGELIEELRRAVREDDRFDSEIIDHTTAGDQTLHVSLSRPFNLTLSEHEPVLEQIRTRLSSFKPFLISFVSISRLDNDQRTRTFLALEIGAGHPQLSQISGEIDAIGLTFGQPEYYKDASRFHASLFSSTNLNSGIFSPRLIANLNYQFADRLSKASLTMHEIIVRIGKRTHQISLDYR